MIMAAQVSPTLLTVALALTYLIVGGITGLALGRAGHGSSLAVSALAVWPLLLPLVGAPPAAVTPPGPYSERIGRTFASLRSVLSDPAAVDVPWVADLDGLEESLMVADARLALVDRLLADAGSEGGPLRAARHAAGREIEAVIDEVLELRLQVGLVALAGHALPVRDRLRELVARARALHEVSEDPVDAVLRYRRVT
ncbi:MAG: hypothetical protein ACI8PZ_001888 [Myxococcota bacterium]|jgi:hypothetical protein